MPPLSFVITRGGFVCHRIPCSTNDPSMLMVGTTLPGIWYNEAPWLVRLDHIGTDEQGADILTKPLGKVMFLTFCENLGIVKRPYSEGPVGR